MTRRMMLHCNYTDLNECQGVFVWSISFFLLKLCCRTVSLPTDHDEIGVVDCDSLHIIETIDDEGRLQVTSDDQLYYVLGLKDHDERADKARKGAAKK
jgi:hypothetical protein